MSRWTVFQRSCLKVSQWTDHGVVVLWMLSKLGIEPNWFSTTPYLPGQRSQTLVNLAKNQSSCKKKHHKKHKRNVKEIWSPNCSRKSAHLFMPFGRSNTCGHPLLTRTPRTLKYLQCIEKVTWNARLNAANAHFQKGKPTFVCWSQPVYDFL